MSRRDAALEFDAIHIEGGLLPAEWLANIASLKAVHQSPNDYGIPKGLNLRDELGRYWRIAQAHWSEFANARAQAQDPQALARRFVQALLRDVFGATDLQPHIAPVEIGERLYPITATAREGRLPMVIAAAGQRLDERDRRYGDSGRQRSVFGLLQDYLNASDAAMWGIASNGSVLRLARDNASLTRPAWIEADLARIFIEERYADFSLLWLLIHASRFGNADALVAQCPLEAWREASKEQGTRARAQLRQGVEEALLALGQGFLSEAANQPLRDALANGVLDRNAYFQQLLRLVYRLIFLLTIEERGLLHPANADAGAIKLYADGYSLRRLRERARRRRAFDRHADLWDGLKPVLAGLAHGQPLLALPALGGLFAKEQCQDLDASTLGNVALLEAVAKLGWIRAGRSLTRINWRDMGPEELGSVYESLLELVPDISADGRVFRFANADESKGNARKTSGSYYTPDSLVQELLDSALEPVIQQRISGTSDPQAALLSITVCDPACGSGHFLLGAARRLATRLAQLRAQGTPSGEDFRNALRDVVAHCIFGVDRNPMAIELARMSLWLEAMTPDKPLGFLDHHLQCGDALLGLTDLAALEQGIPKDAFKALSGDDAKVCKELAKRNAAELKDLQRKRTAQSFGQRDLLGLRPGGLDKLRALEAMPDATLEQIAAKQAAWQSFAEASVDSPLHHAADMLLAAFLLPKNASTQDGVPTTGTVALELLGDYGAPGHDEKRTASREACVEARVLHWPLAFPLVHAAGGFTCVLGNPPWEVSQLGEEEFFASRDAHIASLQGDRRKREIARLEQENPRLWREFISESHRIAATNSFYRSGRYPLTAVGKLNTYALFAEAIDQLTARTGRAGFIVPTGIATDDGNKAYFAEIAQSGRLVSLYDIENREKLFPAVHSGMKFCLLTLGASERAQFVCFVTQVAQLADPRRRFTLTPGEFRLINPNTLTFPIFRSERDAELTKKLYRAAPVLIDESRADGNPWGITFSQGLFNMTSDSGLFANAPGEGLLPLYEAKMINFYDHRAGTYAGRDGGRGFRVLPSPSLQEYADPNYCPVPYYWVEEQEVLKSLPPMWQRAWLLAFKDVTAATNERTVISTIIPRVGVGHTAPLIFASTEPSKTAALLANLDTLVLDYAARQKVGGLHLTYSYVRQFPVLPPESYKQIDLVFIATRVLELTYTTHDLAPWARDLGYDGPPFAFDPERRAILRAELDAYYARLYGLTRDQLRYILDPADVMGADYPSETFRVLKNNEQREFGEYRTRRLVLEAWDALEAEQPVAIPAPKPARRISPRPVYATSATPASVAEEWLAGLVCDVLLQAGAHNDARLRQILTTQLPVGAAHAEVLAEWLTPVGAGRLPQVLGWLRTLLGVPVTAPLSIRDTQALAEVIGDHRTESLARALIEARRQRDTEVSDVMAAAAPAMESDQHRKSG